MSNETMNRARLASWGQPSHRQQHQGSSTGAFSHNSPLASRNNINSTAPIRPSPLSQMTLFEPSDVHGSEAALIADDGAVFDTPSPLPTNAFTRSLQNVRRRSSTQQQQRHSLPSMTSFQQSSNPSPRASFQSASPMNAANQYPLQPLQQQQVQRQQSYGQALQLEQMQRERTRREQLRQHQVQVQLQQPRPVLIFCNLCDMQFMSSAESIPADSEGRAYCSACVSSTSLKIVNGQKARLAEDESNQDEAADGDVDMDGDGEGSVDKGKSKVASVDDNGEEVTNAGTWTGGDRDGSGFDFEFDFDVYLAGDGPGSI